MFVRQRYSPFGGGEIMLDAVVKELQARSFPVAVMSNEWPVGEGVKFIRCVGRRFPRALRARSFSDAACRQLSEMIPTPALVQGNDKLPCCDVFRAGEGVHAAYLAKRRPFETRFASVALSISFFHREMLRLERKTYRSPRLKAVIAISRMVAEEIVEYYDFPKARIHHIPNGISLDRFNLDLRHRHRADMRSKLKVGLDKPVILFVGSGFARKGLSHLIKAVANLDSSPELWVVGHDSRAETFQRLAEGLGLGNRFKLLGPQKDVLPLYGAADVAVLPSIYDPFGTVVIEAMACGLPTVVSDGCGARELVERFDPSLICNITTKGGLSTSLQLALRHADRPETASAVRAAAGHYDFATMIERTVTLYDDLAHS